MEQRELQVMGVIPAPKPVPSGMVNACRTYREAVRMAWALRRVQGDTLASFCAAHGLTPQHLSDYLNKDDGPKRRNLPADHLRKFNQGVGNTLVTQWLVAQDGLTLLEEMQATRRAA